MALSKNRKQATEIEYDVTRFIKGFEGMTNKEIRETIYLVDDGMKFDDAVIKIRESRKQGTA